MPLDEISPAPYRRRARAGLGDVSLDALVQADPGFAQLKTAQTTWAPLAAQILSEGGGKDELYNAALLFKDTYHNLADTMNAASDAFTGAFGHTFTTKTIAGAVAQVQGLASTLAVIGSLPPNDQNARFAAEKAVIGAMTGALVAASGVTAGVSAAIAVGIQIATQFIQNSNIWASAGGTTLEGCPANPTIVVGGAVCLLDPTADPLSPIWRPFPEPNAVYAATKIPIFSATVAGRTWYDFWFEPVVKNGTTTRRIDLAFPMYAELEALARDSYVVFGQKVNLPAEFSKVFFGAWKANRALDLNGMKPVGDEVVLAHVVRAWNLSHEPGAGYEFDPDPNGSHAGNTNGSYIGTLTTKYLTSGGAGHDPLTLSPNNKIRIATGPLKAKKKMIVLRSGWKPFAVPPPSSTAATVAKVALVGAGATAAGIGLYAYFTKQAYSLVARRLYAETAGRAIDKGKQLGKKAIASVRHGR